MERAKRALVALGSFGSKVLNKAAVVAVVEVGKYVLTQLL